MLFGYAYPAYECFKTVEKNKPEIEQLRFWCQYWILIAMLTIFERVGDNFVSWVPMYSEAKLAFVIFLWYPKTKGTTYVYDSFFRPYMAKHETEIDRNLLELKTRAGEMAFIYCQRAASYGQTRIFEVLQYVAAQSTPTPRPRPAQPQPAPRARQPPTRQQTTQPQTEKPPIPSTSSASSSQQEVEEVGPELSSTKGPSSSAPPASMPEPTPSLAPIKKSVSMPAASESSSESASNHVEEVERAVPDNANAPAPPEDTVMEEAIRVTRARLRKTRSAATK